MNYSIYRFTLDIHKTKSQVSIPVLYHDTGIKFYISLTDGGKPYFIEDGCRAVFSAKKADGTDLFNDCIIEDNTRIRYDFTAQTTNSEGMMNCEIRLYGKDQNLITTPAFVVIVDPRVIYDSDVIESYPESTTLDNIVAAENSRIVGEQQRVDAEQQRVAAETARVEAENARNEDEGVRTASEETRIANEAERVATFAHMLGAWVAYSAYEDGTDYTWTWSEGQRYIGICNGKTPPVDKTGFVWSKFVDTGIYIGSGEMPEWCNLQIDPNGDVTEIVQESGQSTMNVMSQKAVTEALEDVNAALNGLDNETAELGNKTAELEKATAELEKATADLGNATAELSVKNEWVKIMDKTLTADEAGVQTIKITKDEEGNAFNLKRLYVFINQPSVPTAKADFSIYADGTGTGNCLVYLNGANRDFGVVGERIAEDHWNITSWHGPNNVRNTIQSGYAARAVDYISDITITYAISEGFAEGTKIKVYGVKA